MKKRDWILIGGILAVALAAALLLFLFRQDGSEAVVRVDGNVVGRYSLAFDGEYSLNGGTNILRIEDGTARLIDADCPDKLCVNRGKIRYDGETITCLPNRLTVTIEKGKKGDVDLIS